MVKHIMGDSEGPKVSILMPARNSEKTIKRSIASVQRQTFESWELIVVDDCSTDKTCELVAWLASDDPRIKLISSKKQVGPGNSRITAFRASKGNVIAMLDSDDLWLPEKLEEAYGLIESGRYRFIHTGHRALVGSRVSVRISSHTVSAHAQITSRNPIVNSSAVFCRSLMKGVTKLDSDRGTDWELWRIFSAEGADLTYISSYSCIYGVYPNSFSGNKVAMASRHLNDLRQISKHKWILARRFFVYAVNGLRVSLLRRTPSPLSSRIRNVLGIDK